MPLWPSEESPLTGVPSASSTVRWPVGAGARWRPALRNAAAGSAQSPARWKRRFRFQEARPERWPAWQAVEAARAGAAPPPSGRNDPRARLIWGQAAGRHMRADHGDRDLPGPGPRRPGGRGPRAADGPSRPSCRARPPVGSRSASAAASASCPFARPAASTLAGPARSLRGPMGTRCRTCPFRLDRNSCRSPESRIRPPPDRPPAPPPNRGRIRRHAQEVDPARQWLRPALAFSSANR